MSTASSADIGREFEEEFADRHGLRVVPGSGNQWHSKLDAYGFGVRWSLKATDDLGYRVTPKDLDELLGAHAPGQDGAMRMMAIKVDAGGDPRVFVLMLEEDFARVATGKYELIRETKTDAKRRIAAIPELLREED